MLHPRLNFKCFLRAVSAHGGACNFEVHAWCSTTDGRCTALSVLQRTWWTAPKDNHMRYFLSLFSCNKRKLILTLSTPWALGRVRQNNIIIINIRTKRDKLLTFERRTDSKDAITPSRDNANACRVTEIVIAPMSFMRFRFRKRGIKRRRNPKLTANVIRVEDVNSVQDMELRGDGTAKQYQTEDNQRLGLTTQSNLPLQSTSYV